MDVKNELIGIISEYIDIPANKINAEEGLKFSSGLDSFAILSLISTIEEHFNISIPDNKLPDFKTINDIITYVEQVA